MREARSLTAVTSVGTPQIPGHWSGDLDSGIVSNESVLGNPLEPLRSLPLSVGLRRVPGVRLHQIAPFQLEESQGSRIAIGDARVARRLLPNDLQVDLAAARTVELEEQHGLPNAQGEAPVHHRNGLTAGKQHGEEVGVSIFGLVGWAVPQVYVVVLIRGIWRCQALKQRPQVL